MELIELDPLLWTRILVALALIVQVAELLMIRSAFSDSGIWRWEDIRAEFRCYSNWVRKFADLVLAYRPFVALLWIELIAAFTLLFLFHPAIVLVLLFSALATAVRWRGTFNGGSDYMTVVLLSALLVASIFPDLPAVVLGAIYYIAVVSCLSYVISGAVKLRSSNWRNGTALAAFLGGGVYACPSVLADLFQRPVFAVISSWAIIGFEGLFPLAFASRELCVLFLLAGSAFHLANAYVIGLNRFFLVWIATYPAVYWSAVQ